MGVVGVSPHPVVEIRMAEHGPLIEGIEKLENPPALPRHGILRPHQPGARPDQDALMPGAVIAVGLAESPDFGEAPQHARGVAPADLALRPGQHHDQRQAQQKPARTRLRSDPGADFLPKRQGGKGGQGPAPGGTRQARQERALKRQEGRAVNQLGPHVPGLEKQGQGEGHHDHDVGRKKVGISESGDRAPPVGIQDVGPNDFDVEVLKDAVDRGQKTRGQGQMDVVQQPALAAQPPSGRDASQPKRAAVAVPYQSPGSRTGPARRTHGGKCRPQHPPNQGERDPAAQARTLGGLVGLGPRRFARDRGRQEERGHGVGQDEDPLRRPSAPIAGRKNGTCPKKATAQLSAHTPSQTARGRSKGVRGRRRAESSKDCRPRRRASAAQTPTLSRLIWVT